MPTNDRAYWRRDSDLGWGVVRVKAIEGQTGKASLIEVQCKSCLAKQLFQVDVRGYVIDGFVHAPDCRAFHRIREEEMGRRAVRGAFK